MRVLKAVNPVIAAGALAFCLALPGSAEAAPPQVIPGAANLDSMLSEHAGHWLAGKATPGMVAAVIKGNHIVALGKAGYARLPDGEYPAGVAMSLDTIFNIGSNTKSMTALLLSMLIQETALTWDTTLATALQLPRAYFHNGVSDDRADVTLRQLVAHRSGFDCADGTVVYSHPQFPAGWSSFTREELLDRWLKGTVTPNIIGGVLPVGYLADCTGTAINSYDYENLNFAIAQSIIDKWSGMEFVEYARTHLVEPYGMDYSYVWAHVYNLAVDDVFEIEAGVVWPYWDDYYYPKDKDQYLDHTFVRSYNTSFNLIGINDPGEYGLAPGAGGFGFDIYDWSKYGTAHLREQSQAWKDVHGTEFTTYNYGFGTSKKTGAVLNYTRMAHTGDLASMRSVISVYPELDLAYLAFANGGVDDNGALSEVLSDLEGSLTLGVDTGGCANTSSVKDVQRFYDQTMFGCAGTVTKANAGTLCKTGYHVCSAEEFYENNRYGGGPAEAPTHHYWTSTTLKYSGTGSNNCSVSATTGTTCNQPMRACAPSTTDPLGNSCNWINCGYEGDTDNSYFGGCANNTTAGTLCCETMISL
ncbi:serine hydrolase domain-containing protein [Polyangium spumosum]|nr:serine hydrolase [Polyangium spumosum]